MREPRLPGLQRPYIKTMMEWDPNDRCWLQVTEQGADRESEDVLVTQWGPFDSSLDVVSAVAQELTEFALRFPE